VIRALSLLALLVPCRAAGAYKDKGQQAKTGGGLPGAAPGGGCGCTQ
jgi:hypothetical protein